MSTPDRTRGWKRTIKLKDLLSDDGSPANARQVAATIVARLRKQPGYEEYGIDDFSLIVDEFNTIAESTPDDYRSEADTVLGHFNEVLSSLYDWADAERVWIA